MQTGNPKSVHILFRDGISHQSIQSLMKTISDAINNGSVEIHLMLSSGGGSCRDGFDMYQYLNSLTIPVYTYNMGHIGSMANVIYQAGRKRICPQESTFMIHKFDWTVQGAFDVEGFREKAGTLEMDQSTFANIMIQRTGLTQNQIYNMFSRATYMNAQEAVNYGMVDEIRAVTIPQGTILLPH